MAAPTPNIAPAPPLPGAPPPLSGAPPIPTHGPIPSAAPIPCPMPPTHPSLKNITPVPYRPPIPSAAPIPNAPAPVPSSYGPPIPSAAPIPIAPVPIPTTPPPNPTPEPQTNSPININKILIQDFLSQNFKTEHINEQKSVLIKSSNPKYYIKQRRRRRISSINALPIIKQYSIGNDSDSKLIYYKMCNRNKSEIIALKDTPLPKTNRNYDSDESEYDSEDNEDYNYAENKIIKFLQGYDRKGRCDDDDLKDRIDCIKTTDINSSNINMLIIGRLPDDIGILLNSEITNHVEPIINDYRYPFRNSEIIYQIMKSRGKDLMRYSEDNEDYDSDEDNKRLYRRPVVSQKQLDYIEKNKEMANNLMEQITHIRNHDKEFKHYKIRIHDLVDPNLNCNVNNDNIIYIPSVFKYSSINDNIEIFSDINNLSRMRYPKIYKIISSLFKKMLPSFEWVLKSHFKNECIKQFRVIVKLQNYELYPKMRYCSSYHCEGLDEEKIVAVGVYYYNKSKYFDKDIFEISHKFKFGGLFGNIDYENMKQEIDIESGNFIVFNNRHKYLHRVKEIHNSSDKYIVKRKIITFFLVDPYLSSYNKNKVKTSKEIIVNVDDKYELVICYWLRKCKCYKMLSKDVMNLLMFYAVKDQKKAISKRNVMKIKEFLNDAENKWKNRPKPRRKD